ncbi:MAG: protein translocase subunit SecF [Rhodospirillaceae bacterium]|jgi:preprotein translocase subunit SecF|nr:protein translocase subunit SecF [Rhodospirillaceae bacterium]MBT4219800.1 protein translocase subunit SecF [Rhodospirillaceae bacterium]MBT5013232.1 protein translocase subunit SecF [Rhodospirillaceae bacterium]MBT5308016.1 protein translocase subunit SecF [Rhodospirillaceae bacterium]MBT7356241.1 protein translocase subunit SecF [Rhodospirillaceae bacterium]
MRGLHLIPADINIGFINRKKIFFVFSVLLVIASIGLFASKGLNYGIDFKGGILIEVKTTDGPADVQAMRGSLSGLGLGEVGLQEFGAPNEVLIRIQAQDGGEKAQAAAIEKVKAALGGAIEYRRTEFVGPKISDELFWDGVSAVAAAIFAILVYVWFRFEWQFGLGAVVALVHDVISTIGIFALLGLEFNLSTVAAILTIAGYSINDTVVVYDRVRENLRRYKTMNMTDLLNKSINETLSRTVMTSVTTLLALLSLYLLGGEVISGFSFAMIWGVIVGTYSSICLAVPLLLYLNVSRRSGDMSGEATTEEA